MEENKMKFGEKFKFDIDMDLMEYGIEEEVKEISKQLDKIMEKSNATAVIDLMQDINSSIELDKLYGNKEVDLNEITNKG